MKKRLYICITIIAFIALTWLTLFNSYSPTDEAIKVSKQAYIYDHYLAFEGTNTTGIIMYPGGKVSYEAYAPLMASLSQEGYHTYIIEMPLDLAVLGRDRANQVIKDHPEITDWYIMGHSLGGVMAASYANHHDTIKGLILLAAYPQEKDDLSGKPLKVLSLLGDHDGLVDKETFENSRNLLPEETTMFFLIGGNHAYMGSYGEQRKDLKADISEKQQRSLIVDAIINWIN